MTERAANEVAGAIFGDRYNRRLQSKRSLEAAVASWVVDLLEREGFAVTNHCRRTRTAVAIRSVDHDPSCRWSSTVSPQRST